VDVDIKVLSSGILVHYPGTLADAEDVSNA
jgi:hypothetical protein